MPGRLSTWFRKLAQVFDCKTGALTVTPKNTHSRFDEPQCSTATLRLDDVLGLDSGAPIEAVWELLDHKHITTTQIYDKRRAGLRQPQDGDSKARRGLCGAGQRLK